MDNIEVQKRISALLQEFGEPGFIVFGWKKDDGQFGVAYATHKAPPPVVVKGMLWAVQDYAKSHI
jgi:hypothetical protein